MYQIGMYVVLRADPDKIVGKIIKIDPFTNSRFLVKWPDELEGIERWYERENDIDVVAWDKFEIG